ncbi:MAG: hypothetical protein ACLTIG_13290 [Roseburia hominis]
MGMLFPNQSFGVNILKHEELPILKSHEFDFLDALSLKIITMEKL